MRCFLADLSCREVINISSGSRLGYVSDLEIDTDSGSILSLSVPGDSKCFGLFGRGEDIQIPWQCVCRIGEDIILVDLVRGRSPARRD